jgi:hypothetical protein
LILKAIQIHIGNKKKERKNNGHMLGTKIEWVLEKEIAWRLF